MLRAADSVLQDGFLLLSSRAWQGYAEDIEGKRFRYGKYDQT